MAKLVQVVYLGNKPFATDNVAKSGKQWSGYGDVQEVTPEQAKILIKYPDQWALGDGKNLPSRAAVQQKLAEVHAAAAERSPGSGGKRLEDMTKEELMVHADKFYGIALDREKTLPEMLAQLDDAVRDAGITAEFERNKNVPNDGGFEKELDKIDQKG